MCFWNIALVCEKVRMKNWSSEVATLHYLLLCIICNFIRLLWIFLDIQIWKINPIPEGSWKNLQTQVSPMVSDKNESDNVNSCTDTCICFCSVFIRAYLSFWEHFLVNSHWSSIYTGLIVKLSFFFCRLQIIFLLKTTWITLQSWSNLLSQNQELLL